jgi:tetratricopeptide (TPR) repeat protein
MSWTRRSALRFPVLSMRSSASAVAPVIANRPATAGRRDAPVLPSVVAAELLPKPRRLSGKADKRYHAGVHAYLRGDYQQALNNMNECLSADPSILSAHLIAALAIGEMDGSQGDQIRHLETVVRSNATLPDKLQRMYLLPPITLSLHCRVTEQISADVPFDSAGASLLLAECYQTTGRLREALGLVQVLHDEDPQDPAVALSLADLMLALGDYGGVVEVAKSAENDSDVGAAMLHLRGAALFALGHRTAAIDSFRDALSNPTRDAELLKIIRYDRALAYEANGQRGRAKQDLELIDAVDPGYEDVKQRLAAVE